MNKQGSFIIWKQMSACFAPIYDDIKKNKQIVGIYKHFNNTFEKCILLALLFLWKFKEAFCSVYLKIKNILFNFFKIFLMFILIKNKNYRILFIMILI